MWNSKMAEQSAYMSIVEDPTKRLRERISRIDLAVNEPHLDVVVAFPILNCKVGNINVSRSFCWDTRVYNFDGIIVVFIQHCRIFLWEA